MKRPFFSYEYSMKKTICVFLTACFALALTACGEYDYSAHLSDVRSDLFCAETDEFTVTLSCVSREYPYVSDGVASARTDLVEIVLTSAESEDYEIYVLSDAVWGGDMSFRNVTGDYFYSRGVTEFPQDSVSLRVEWNAGEEVRELTATSIKNEKTISAEQALDAAVTAEKDTVNALMNNGVFCGELYVRLLRRDKNYYYVGIVDTDGKTVSLLLDSETGEILARRVTS